MINNELEYREDLNYNFLRHKLLSILVRQRIDAELYHKTKVTVIGVNFAIILKNLQISREELFIVASTLFEDLEIEYYNVEFEGYFAKHKGVVSYFSKKYIKSPKKEKRENIKYYYQIVVPILSLLIAVMSIGFNIYQVITNKNQIEKLEQKVKYLSNQFISKKENINLKSKDSLINNKEKLTE